MRKKVKMYTQEEYDKKVIEDKKKRFIILIIVIILYMLIKNTLYYGEVETVLNAKDYYMLSKADIVEMYGEPKNGNEYEYDMGEYVLEFDFAGNYIGRIRYMPNEPFEYKYSLQNAFYIFGLQSETGKFKQDQLREHVFRAVSKDYYLDTLLLMDVDEKDKTAEYITIFFNYDAREKMLKGE